MEKLKLKVALVSYLCTIFILLLAISTIVTTGMIKDQKKTIDSLNHRLEKEENTKTDDWKRGYDTGYGIGYIDCHDGKPYDAATLEEFYRLTKRDKVEE